VTTLLSVEQLSLAYRSRSSQRKTVVSDINLELGSGEILGLAGESGCGKSTLALAMTGYRAPETEVTGGRVLLGDIALSDLSPKEIRSIWGRRIAYVPQNASGALNPSMRIDRHFREVLSRDKGLRRQDSARRTHELLERVGLPDPERSMSAYPHEFSGGQQQRLSLALAIATEPEILILDEPTTGLDILTQARITALLQSILRETRMAALYISHDIALLGTTSDRLAIMYGGHIVEMGHTPDIVTSPMHPYTRALLASTPDITRRNAVRPICGQPPLSVLSDVCAFASRCDWVQPSCHRHIELIQFEDRRLRCTRPQAVRDTAPSTEPPHSWINDISRSHERQSLLQVDNLTLRYPGRPGYALSDFSLSFWPGESLGLVGESGSGKSTLVKLICGLETPTSGSLRFAGQLLKPRASQRTQQHRRDIQLIFQDATSSLNPAHTAQQILERPLRIYQPQLSRAERREEACRLLDSVKLGAELRDRYPPELSGGQKQRLAIARALAARPRLILCDEVTSALDVSVQASMVELLAGIVRSTGAAMVFVSHDLALVRSLCHRTVVLHHGHIREAGDTESVFNNPRDQYTRDLLDAIPRVGHRYDCVPKGKLRTPTPRKN
jgi:peptide/nickel transport system ATP-binding protein